MCQKHNFSINKKEIPLFLNKKKNEKEREIPLIKRKNQPFIVFQW